MGRVRWLDGEVLLVIGQAEEATAASEVCRKAGLQEVIRRPAGMCPELMGHGLEACDIVSTWSTGHSWWRT